MKHVYHPRVTVRAARTADLPRVHELATRSSAQTAHIVDAFGPLRCDFDALVADGSGGLLIADRAAEICGLAAYARDGETVVLFYLLASGAASQEAARALVSALELLAHNTGAALICVRATDEPRRIEFFSALGYAVDYKERDVREGQIVTEVDLIKAL